jgi:hypothetical protein
MAKLSDFELLRQAQRLGYTLENEDEILQKEAQRLGFNIVGAGTTASAPVFAAPETTVGGELLEVLKGLPRGAIGLLETAAAGAAAVLPDEAERQARASVTEFFQPAKEAFAPEVGYEESIGAQAGQALGSTLPFFALGPLGVAGRAATVGLSAAAGAGEARLRAEQEGGMEDRGLATALGVAPGLLDVLPVFRILDRLPEKQTLQIFDYVKRAALAGGEEGAQEAAQNITQNLIEKGVYNPEQDLFEGAAKEGAYGFGVGAFVQGLLDVSLGRRVRGAVAPPGGEDGRTRIGAEKVVEGADTGGTGLPVSRIGTAGSDVEGVTPAGVGVSDDVTRRIDEGTEGVQPALDQEVFYHGTRRGEIPVFDPTLGSTAGSWFTKNKTEAEQFGEARPYTVDIKSPASMEDFAQARQEVVASGLDINENPQVFNKAVIENLESKGFDGIRDANFKGAGGVGNEVVAAFRPEQIKPIGSLATPVSKATPSAAPAAPLESQPGTPSVRPVATEVVKAMQVTPERAQAVVQDTTQGWTNAPKIVVAQSINDPVIPEPLRKQIPADARGFYNQGAVYVLADRAPSESAVRATVFHESLGHYGLEQLFRDRLDQVLNDVYSTNTAIRAAVNKWVQSNPDVYTGPDRNARAVEEILAERSEKGVIKEPGVRAAFNRIAALVRKFLRSVGLAKTYTNNDIDNILREAAKRVRSQPGPVFNSKASPKFQIGQYNKVLSNVLEQNQKLPEWSQSLGDGVVNTLSTLPENLRKTQYYIYSMPHLVELLEKYVPRIKAIERYIGYRASYTSGLMKESSDNHARYTRAVREHPELYDKFKDVVNEINLYQVPVREKRVKDLLKQPRSSLPPQAKKYYDVAKKFYELPKSLQDSILSEDSESGLFADYRRMGDEKLKIFEDVYGGQLGSGVVKKLRERFEKERLTMYAPLVRGEGAHWLYYETPDGRQYKEAFSNQAAREVAIRKAIEEGRAAPNTIVRATRESEIRDKGPPPGDFLGSVIKQLEETLPKDMGPDARREIIDSVYDTFIQYLPSGTLRQELTSRQTSEVNGAMQFGLLGFDKDVLAVYERSMPKMAYQLGNLKFALPIENAMTKVREQASDYEAAVRENKLPEKFRGRKVLSPKALYDGVEDMRRRLDFAYNPSYAWWVNGLATGNYLYSIAGNVSSALINTTVLMMMTFPSLVAKYGVVKSSAMMLRAMKMFGQGGVDEQGNFTFGTSATGEVKTFFDYLTKRGVIGIAAEQELRQAQRAKVSGYESTLDKVNYVMGYVFKNSERFNREVTMLASFMLARERGMGFRTAAEEAIRLNNNINGTVLPEAASRMYQTNLGRVILTFRTFALNQIINLSRAFGRAVNAVDATPEERAYARKQLLGIYGATYLVSGVKGLPLFGAAEVLAAALMGDDDEPYDLQQEVLDSVGLLGLNGPLNAAFGVDIASRTGFNGMLWRDDPKRLADIGFVLYAAERLAGPSYGLIQAQARGWDKVANGDFEGGMESILPAPLRNPLKAARYVTEGALTKDGQPIVDDISSWNSVMQVFGFAPAELAATQEQVSTRYTISDKLRNRRTALMENLYTAITTGDDDATQKAFAAIDKFNAANPMFGINPRSLRTSFRERNRRAVESINGVYLPRNLYAATEEYMADLD